jgi:HEPN domain-containing protein
MQKHEEWLILAQEDLLAAHHLLEAELIRLSSFHCQQSAEKALKGFLAFKKQDILKTHDLVKLIKLCSNFDEVFNTLERQAELLNPYISKSRYPEDCLVIPTESKAKEALIMAKEILNFVKIKIV